MLDYELLEKLCTANGISGDEGRVRQIILDEIKPYASEITIDRMGNVIVFKKGEKPAECRLMISAHMDEVGFIVTDITDKGFLKIAPVGGINRCAACGKQVTVGEENIFGVIGIKPVHLTKGDERKKNPPIDELMADIGADSKKQAENHVKLGDSVCFDAPYEHKNGRIISKALDDRFGCLVLIEMIKSNLPYDMTFCFTVQEEVGLRGAKAAAYTADPDCAIVVEATTAADVPFSEGEKRVCRVGEGAVVSFMDRATIYDRKLYQAAMNTAKRLGVKAQTKTMIAGGNDAGAIHCSRGGVRTVAVSVPCRYLHGISALISTEDAESVYAVVRELAALIASNDSSCR